MRVSDDRETFVYEDNSAGLVTAFDAPIKVVLTVAHLNHDPTDNDPANLRALCQRCHLVHDKAHHAATRRSALERAGQQTLDLEP